MRILAFSLNKSYRLCLLKNSRNFGPPYSANSGSDRLCLGRFYVLASLALFFAVSHIFPVSPSHFRSLRALSHFHPFLFCFYFLFFIFYFFFHFFLFFHPHFVFSFFSYFSFLPFYFHFSSHILP